MITMAIDALLRNHQLSTEIIDLIEEASEYVFLVTPYFKPWKLLTRAMATAARNEKNMVVIIREIPENHALARSLNSDYGFDVVLISNLHTKLYLSERRAIVTSMNLYDASKENNYEIGYRITARNIVKEIRKKIISDDLLSLPPALFLPGRYTKAISDEKKRELKKQAEREQKKTEALQKRNQVLTIEDGFCIRCGESIPFSDYVTLCRSCFEIWSVFENWDYPENQCHRCGTRVQTSKRKPLCDDCFRIKSF